MAPGVPPREGAPKFPFPIDEAWRPRVSAVFDAHCAGCHASDRPAQRMPLVEVEPTPNGSARGTRTTPCRQRSGEQLRHRAQGARRGAALGYNRTLLDGIWLRAPYLHNGSVPSLHDLLTPPERGPEVFWRGYDVYDPVTVGFISQGDRGAACRDEVRHPGTRWEQAGPRVRNRFTGAGKGGTDRIPEDALTTFRCKSDRRLAGRW